MSLWSRPGDDGLTASDRLVRDLKREGLPDAEIATRVGISITEVKQRLERLAAAPPATPAPKPPRRPVEQERGRPVSAASPGVVELGRAGIFVGRHWRLLMAAVVALGIGALGAGWALGGEGSSDPRIISISPGAPVLTYGFAAEGQPLEPGITVTGSATATFPADRAFIMPSNPVDWVPTPGDRIVIANRLRALGLPEEAFEVMPQPQFGNYVTIAVEVPIESVSDLGPQVADLLGEVASAIARANMGPMGVRFALNDCSAALAAVGAAAVGDARATAARLAEAAGLPLGPPVRVRDASSEADVRFGQPVPCPETPADVSVFFSGAIPPFDAPPEVTVSAHLSVTFAVEGQEPSSTTVTASGTALVAAVPDVAYLVVRTFSNSGSASANDDARWTELVAGLAELDIAEGQATFGANSGTGTVAVRISAADIDLLGAPVLGLLRAYAGVVQDEGVVYATEDCAPLAAEAEKAAAEDAAGRAENLAALLGGKLGAVVRVSSLLPSYQECPATPETGPLIPLEMTPELSVAAALQVTFVVEPE